MNKCFFLFFFLLLFPTSLRGQETLDENLVKALFIKRIIAYTDWEDSSKSDSFTVAFLGDSEVKKYVKQLFTQDKNFAEKVRFLNVSERKLHKPYEVLIVGDDYSKKLKKIHPNTLSIMVNDGKYSDSAVLKFLVVDNSVHFQVNRDILDKAGFTLSSRVLKLSYSDQSEAE